MKLQQLIGIIAGVIAFASIWPYVIDILRGNTKPSRAAYGIWLVVEAVTAASYIASGARSTIWVVLIWAFSALLIFCLSIKYGIGGYGKLDIVCLILAAMAITLWISTRNPQIALYASLLADKLGYIPVFKKTYLHPKTENLTSWAMVAIAGTLNLIALTNWQPRYSLLPITNFVAEYLVLGIIVKRRYVR